MPTTGPVVLRSSLSRVLDAVKDWLVAQLGLPATRVLKVARDPRLVPHLNGDQDILLRPRGFTPVAANRGRDDCRIHRRLSVVIRSRLELDEADQDEKWLEHATGGAVVFEEDVLDALQGWLPEDANLSTLFFEPVFVLQGLDPDREIRSGKKMPDWGEVELVFALPIRLPLTQTRQ